MVFCSTSRLASDVGLVYGQLAATVVDDDSKHVQIRCLCFMSLMTLCSGSSLPKVGVLVHVFL